MEKLTEKQIRNWRETLSMSLGPYAWMMPVEQIEKLRDKLQNDVDKEFTDIEKDMVSGE